MELRCELIEGPRKGHVETVEDGGALLVGRAVRKGLRLHGDDAVSRNHCLLFLGGGAARVEDLGSRNGTLLNGQRIGAPVELRSGDRVGVGRTTLQVRLVGGALDGTQVECRRCGGVPGGGPGTAFDEDDDPAAGRICAACRARVAEEEPQAVFGGFEVLKKLGQGAMGAVWLARAPALSDVPGDLVALKTLLPGLALDREARAMFLREAELGARLDHPHAVRVLGSGYRAGVFFFAMEYVPGQDLQRFMEARGGPLGLDEALPILTQLLSVLEHAHGRGLVHRDIKPSNVLLARAGPAPFAKLADFGLMRSFAASGQSQLTLTGEGKGTPHYMPPEQVEDAAGVGPAADVYALAATFFHLLSGATPLDLRPGRNPLLMVLEGRPRTLADVGVTVPGAVDDVLQRCFVKDPAGRIPTATALRAELSRALGRSLA